MNYIVITSFFLTIGISFGAYANETKSVLNAKQIEINQDHYVPRMGEIMSATQMRHSKLWFAGKARNWDLASYELDEIKEGLDDATKYHPVFKKDAPIASILNKFTALPLNDIGRAIMAKDIIKFRKSFDNLTNGCNACHQAASQGFIVIKRPDTMPFSNQDFDLKTK